MTYDGTYHVSAETSFQGTWVSVSAYFETHAEAVEAAAAFPKSCKVKAFACTVATETGVVKGSVRSNAKLSANAVNHGVNESGVKRMNRTIDFILDGEYDISFDMKYSNSLSEGEILDWLTPTFDTAEEA